MGLKFNYLRVFTQDYALGKMISVAMCVEQMVLLFLRQPSRKLWSLFGFIVKIKPQYSMLSTVRLLNLYYLAQETERLGLKGDVVECGVWNGGAAAMTSRGYHDIGDHRTKRTIWLFDSFEGLPAPSAKDSKSEVECYFEGLCKGSIENVKDIFHKLGLDMENVRIVKGWLDVTMKSPGIKEIALLHIDTDWYDSVKTPLDRLYPNIVPGGFVVIDDYWFHQGCKAAVHDFIKENSLEGKIKLIKVDRSAVYFQKP